MDNVVWVKFRRERTHQEFANEGDEGGRWKDLGEMSMVSVPAKDESVWINGDAYDVLDRSWSFSITDRDVPNFTDPQVMLTLRPTRWDPGSWAPEEDFFEG